MSIEYADTLHTLAQIAVALMGFSGIVVVFGERTASKWTAEESMSLYALLAPGVTVLFCSFVPILLSAVLEEPVVSWRISNGVLGVLHAGNLAGFLISCWKTRAKITLGQRSNIVFAAMVIAAHFLSAAGLIPWVEFVFILGLLQQLWVSVHNFFLLFRANVGAAL